MEKCKKSGKKLFCSQEGMGQVKSDPIVDLLSSYRPESKSALGWWDYAPPALSVIPTLRDHPNLS